MDNVTWNESEANLVKEPTVFTDFEYDNETDGGCLNKLEEINGIINDIYNDVDDISAKYSELQTMYDNFTDYNSKMDSNKRLLTNSINNIKTDYNSAVNQMSIQLSALQQNDATLMDDLNMINSLLGGSSTTNTQPSKPSKPTTNTPYTAKYSGATYDKIKAGLQGLGLSDEELLKLADAIYESTGDNALSLGALALNPLSYLVDNYDDVMKSLGSDGINIINKVLSTSVDGLEFHLPKEMLDNFMHDEGMTNMLQGLSNGFDLSSTSSYLEAITNFANNNDITFANMNNMITGFDGFVTTELNNTLGSALGVQFDSTSTENIWNALINYYDYKDIDLSFGPNYKERLQAKVDTHNQLSDAILSAIPDKEAAVKNILSTQLGIDSNIDLSTIDCESVLHGFIRNLPKVADCVSNLQDLSFNSTGLGVISEAYNNTKEIYTNVNELLEYLRLDHSDISDTIKNNISIQVNDTVDSTWKSITSWWG